VVICDMWDHHWCKGATARVRRKWPRALNKVVTELRSRGVLIIHCPSGTMQAYENSPGRKLAQSATQGHTTGSSPGVVQPGQNTGGVPCRSMILMAVGDDEPKMQRGIPMARPNEPTIETQAG
jgi:hypothetical protein